MIGFDLMELLNRVGRYVFVDDGMMTPTEQNQVVIPVSVLRWHQADAPCGRLFLADDVAHVPEKNVFPPFVFRRLSNDFFPLWTKGAASVGFAPKNIHIE